MAKILIVEDEASLLSLLQMIVEELGHQVFTATNGKQGLSIIEAEPIGLVLSDVMMPEMNGYTLLENIKLGSQWQHIKVVLISAANINRQTPFQADEYVEKPYEIATIEKIIQRLT